MKDAEHRLDCVVLGDAEAVLDSIESESVDMVLTSPPYDDLRTYGGCNWSLEKCDRIIRKLFRVLKPGHVCVWVVGDATNGGSETLSSFKQALAFRDAGFNVHDTMIYEKNSSAFPASRNSKRYTQIFEYMFVFSKGKIRDDIQLIADKPNVCAGATNWGGLRSYREDGTLADGGEKRIKPVPDVSLRNNIWKYTTSINRDDVKHPAVFPEELARDHILSWTLNGEVVLDPFMGSGTTGKMAVLTGRHFIGIEQNEEYQKMAQRRCDRYCYQTSLFNDDQIKEATR